MASLTMRLFILGNATGENCLSRFSERIIILLNLKAKSCWKENCSLGGQNILW